MDGHLHVPVLATEGELSNFVSGNAIHSQPVMGLIVKSSAIHAAGVYTTAPIKKGAHVVEYTGPILSKEQADDLYEERAETYLFSLDDGRLINGHGAAMFINHCCDPNCETDEIDGRIWVIALRKIKAGEELTYDYCLWDGHEEDPASCFCGSKNCRGTMYSEEEIKRRAKEKKKENRGFRRDHEKATA